MRKLLNTLYVMTEGSYLHLDHDNVVIEVQGKENFRVPLHHICALVTFGNVLVSPFTLHRFADEGKSVVLLDRNGRFKARVTGSTGGNVLLRKAQYECLDLPEKHVPLARNIVAGKIKNCRHLLLRAAREVKQGEEAARLSEAASILGEHVKSLQNEDDLEMVRGIEGAAAHSYFEVFDLMIRIERSVFSLETRSRRPPRDPLNAVLSFLYTLLVNDCISALESVGLDPQVGYLHALRPGRPALALDLMEEFRALLAERTVLSLVNRRQITEKDFETQPGGAVFLNEKGKKTVVVAYQKRKQEEISHPFLKAKVPYGLLPQLQARFLARYLRGDTTEYIPYLIR